MKVISDVHGFTLKFDDLEDLKGHTNNLQGMVEWLEDVMPKGYEPEFTYRVYEWPEDGFGETCVEIQHG